LPQAPSPRAPATRWWLRAWAKFRARGQSKSPYSFPPRRAEREFGELTADQRGELLHLLEGGPAARPRLPGSARCSGRSQPATKSVGPVAAVPRSSAPMSTCHTTHSA
jgi:hypothetical protein